jgi:hypothetical protein
VLIEIFDLTGRRRASNRLDGLTAGPHEARVATEPPLAGGLYFARITQGASTARRRFLVSP